jgi:hypothetical protein
MDVGQTVHDGHAIDGLVVLRFHVLAAEILEDGVAHLDLITTAQLVLLDQLIVDVRAVGRAKVFDEPSRFSLVDATMTARHAVRGQHDLIAAFATDTQRFIAHHLALAEVARVRRIDDHETVIATAFRLGDFAQWSDAGFDLGIQKSYGSTFLQRNRSYRTG